MLPSSSSLHFENCNTKQNSTKNTDLLLRNLAQFSQTRSQLAHGRKIRPEKLSVAFRWFFFSPRLQNLTHFFPSLIAFRILAFSPFFRFSRFSQCEADGKFKN